MKYVELCNKIGKSPSGVARELGLSKATASGWKAGKKPNDSTIKKVADYFGVPFSYFDNDANFDLQMFAESKESTPQEQSLMDIYRQLDEIGRAKLLVYAATLLQ